MLVKQDFNKPKTTTSMFELAALKESVLCIAEMFMTLSSRVCNTVNSANSFQAQLYACGLFQLCIGMLTTKILDM